ncbi:MAG: hypothetical protein ACI9KE_000428 [Polyangiales bacterium]|jgi:hypothetical protein
MDIHSIPIARRLEELPVLPMVVARLMSLNASSDDYFDEVVKPVSLEPSYAGWVGRARVSLRSFSSLMSRCSGA